ncbi:MAG TPA: hypothetical protein VF796_03450 [Humisphaera sp.]
MPNESTLSYEARPTRRGGTAPAGSLPQAGLLVAAVAVGAAIKVKGGNYDPLALALVGLALVAATVAVVTLRRASDLFPVKFLWLAAGLAVFAQIGLLAVGEALPGSFPPQMTHLGPRKSPALAHAATAGAGILMLLSAFWAARAARQPNARPAVHLCFVAGLLIHLVATSAAVDAVPWPVFDFYEVQREAALELLSGGNPYAMKLEFWSPGWAVHWDASLIGPDGKPQFGFLYPPLSLLHLLPFQLANVDFRFAHAATFTVAGAFAGACGRGPGPKLAAAVLLTTPFGPHLIAAGWTEPAVAVWLAATVWAACRRPAGTGWMLGLLAASKQYVPLTAPLAWLLVLPGGARGGGRRGLVKLLVPAVVVAAVVTLPLALWDVRAFVFSTVTAQLRQPFRPDSLSVLAMMHRMGVTDPPAVLGFVALAAAQALALWRAPRTPAGFAAAVALALLAFFAFSKQAFANYYFLVAVAAAVALAAAGRDEREVWAAAEPEAGDAKQRKPRRKRSR